jgi:hypothetical protein
MKRVINIEVTRTIQVRQFEPVTVKVSETITIDDDHQDDAEARNELYRVVTQANKKFLDNERLKATKDNEAQAMGAKKR